MTGNVAQVFLTDGSGTQLCGARMPRSGPAAAWSSRPAIRPAGVAGLESRRLVSRADVPGVGVVQSWAEVSGIRGDLVSFRSVFVFEADGATLTSELTLRFRRREEVADSLMAAGFVVDDLRDAPDRPGRELVFVARRPG